MLAPDGGEVLLDGRPWSALREHERRPLRRQIQLVHQDPLGSFDPRFTVRRILAEALSVAGERRGAGRAERALRLLEQVGLGAEHLERRPVRLSGGQRQRVAVARALATGPRLLVCDEPVSALDVSVQAQVLDLLAGLRERLGLAMLFISHDLAVVRQVSDRVLVMKDGRAVEYGRADEVFRNPGHPYTRELLAAVPRLPGHRCPAAGHRWLTGAAARRPGRSPGRRGPGRPVAAGYRPRGIASMNGSTRSASWYSPSGVGCRPSA
jgi:peptide/nickel transport system ATP-binding protein